jgi:hypothetical protein
MSYADDLKIFMNIIAQSPDGLGDPQLIGKFAKAKAGLNMMSSMNEMQAQNVMPPAPIQPASPMGVSQEPLGAVDGGLGQPSEPNNAMS